MRHRAHDRYPLIRAALETQKRVITLCEINTLPRWWGLSTAASVTRPLILRVCRLFSSSLLTFCLQPPPPPIGTTMVHLPGPPTPLQSGAFRPSQRSSPSWEEEEVALAKAKATAATISMACVRCGKNISFAVRLGSVYSTPGVF